MTDYGENRQIYNLQGFKNDLCKIVEERERRRERHLVLLLFNKGYPEKASLTRLPMSEAFRKWYREPSSYLNNKPNWLGNIKCKGLD